MNADNINEKQIQWFPGHMARARRILSENLKLVDVVVEIVDARIPFSSRNPEIDKMLNQKPRVIIGNKKDLSDPKMNGFWKNYYASKGIKVYYTDCKSGNGVKDVIAAVKEAKAEKFKRYEEAGRKPPVIRVMTVGIPNVGKSSLINKIVGKNVAVTGDKPGVTRNKQWLRIHPEIMLLDTPGLLWPKFEDVTVGEHLAFTGAVKDNILDIELLAIRLIEILGKNYPELLKNRFGELDFTLEPYDLLCQIGKKRGMVIRGGETDTERAANMLLEEYRNQKIGNISLERVEDYA